MPTLSALTIAAGRAEHLRNVIRGLQAQTEKPLEMIVAVMQDAPYDALPASDFPVRQIMVPLVNGELPLAAARNRAAEAAQGEVLAFVDVDCIPDPTFVADYTSAATPGRGLLMGEVLYLKQGATDHGLDFAVFNRSGVRHSDRQGPPPEGLRRCEDYRCFWSLNYAMHRIDWERAGGFDEGYYGYGGEDTDFGRGLDEKSMRIWWMKGARVYHQYHQHCMPPIHQVASVIRNSEYFATRWGHRTMEHWLYGFRLLGLIENCRTGIRILRQPNEADFALCRQEPSMPYANTRRVLDKLEGVDEARRGNKARETEVEVAQSGMLRFAAE